MNGKPKSWVGRNFAFLAAALCLVTAAHAAKLPPLSQYGIDSWDGSDGLPQIRIRSIVQTRDGYLWLGTANGLVRFDGVDFTTFGVESSSLKDNEISGLIEDNDGALWIGTFGGGLTRFKEGKFTTFTAADGLPDLSIRKLDLDREGTLWFATPHGVGRYAGGKFTVFTTRDGLPSDFVTSICAGSSQGIFAVAGGRLNRLVDGRFVAEPSAMDADDGRMDSMASGADGSIWMTFESSRIKCWKNGKLTTYLPGDYGSDRPGAIYEHNGSLWIAVRNGLLRFNNGAFDVLTNTEAQAKLGLVLSMAADHEGDLWLGSEANGLARLRCVAVRVLTAEDGLAENSTRCVFRDSHGDIWIGSYLGFSRLSHGKLTAYTTIDGHPIPTVTSIAEDLQGRLWIAAGGRLLVRQDGHLSPLPEWTSVFDIKVIARDNRGEMWIGTDGDGLFRYSQGKFTVYRKRDGLGSGQIRAILGERDGTLWIGTTAGLSRYENGVFTNFTTADGLANNRVMSLLKDDEGCLWVGTRGGLSRYHDGHFSNITEKDGLPNDYVFNVLDDRRGNFWLSTPAGISAARKTDLDALADGKKQKINVASLGYRDGLRSSSLVAGTVPNACRDDEGQLMFCSLKGLVIVNPQNQLPNGEILPVYIESVLINKHPVPVDQPVALPPGGGELEIHYTALSYVAPEKVLFRYRLDGIDTAWVDAGKRRFAHYAHLPPGTYRFRVIACNNDGVWNEAGARFAFRLPPHFYQTKWFDAAVGLGIIGLTAGWYRLRIRRLQDEETELRRRVDEAVAQVRVLSGLLPICSGCRKIRDDKGYWSRIENYISKHADVKFSHSLCPDCLQRLYPDYADGLITSVKTPEPPGLGSFK